MENTEEKNNEKSFEILKAKIISMYLKYGNKKVLRTSKYTFTGVELAREIEVESDFGIKLVGNLIHLTIDMLSRDKLNIKD